MQTATENQAVALPSDEELARLLSHFVFALSMTDVLTISRAVQALWDARFVKGVLAELALRDTLVARLETIFDAMPKDFKERLVRELRAEGVK